MRGHCIIGQRIAFSAQVKVAFAYLKKYLYIPAFSINPDDFILIQIYICGNEAEIFLAVVTIVDVDYFCRNDFPILHYINHNRKQIF